MKQDNALNGRVGLQLLGRAVGAALGFLTTLPLPFLPHDLEAADFARASGFYPLAGALVGLGVGGVWWLASWLHLGPQVSAALALCGWLILTGMLHFDGLLDSADAVLVSKPPAQRLDILKDVHIGAFGLGVGGAALLLKFALLSAPQMQWWWPVIAAVTARGAVTLPMQFYPAARQVGLGAASRGGWWRLALLLSLGVLLGSGGGLALVLGLASSLATASFCARRLGGGLTGDSYGACIEVAELAALLGLQVWAVNMG